VNQYEREKGAIGCYRKMKRGNPWSREKASENALLKKRPVLAIEIGEGREGKG